jgi:hypothetical protein
MTSLEADLHVAVMLLLALALAAQTFWARRLEYRIWRLENSIDILTPNEDTNG